jgi:hypothetical protein
LFGKTFFAWPASIEILSPAASTARITPWLSDGWRCVTFVKTSSLILAPK